MADSRGLLTCGGAAVFVCFLLGSIQAAGPYFRFSFWYSLCAAR